MKLFVGLGNPGDKYAKTRHNVGFLYLDFYAAEIAKQNKLSPPEFITDSYLQASVAKIRTNTDEYIFIKPQTFMNKSGIAVRLAMKKYFPADHRLLPNDLVVVHDDLDIPFGKCKVQLQGPKLHNGIDSIENHLHINNFLRIRIGVDNRTAENRIPGEAYVLQSFSDAEYTSLADIFPQVAIRFEAYLQSNSNCT
jgi:PTH1 family peptidyl-tRNA hydrolase